ARRRDGGRLTVGDLEAERQEQDVDAGIRWHFRVNEDPVKRSTVKRLRDDGATRPGVSSEVIGGLGYADDAGLCGEVEEVHRAEGIFVQTLMGWEERVSACELAPEAACRMTSADLARTSGARCNIGEVCKAWKSEGKFGRGDRSGLQRHARLTIMKAATVPTVLAFC
ncbi:unnamed protein product, partial [Prorocentrum cordatum]